MFPVANFITICLSDNDGFLRVGGDLTSMTLGSSTSTTVDWTKGVFAPDRYAIDFGDITVSLLLY